MKVEAVGPRTVALATGLHPTKLSGSSESIADKAVERELAVRKVKSDPGVERGKGIKIDDEA